jgi:membrane associated rhomboid family serine protease
MTTPTVTCYRHHDRRAGVTCQRCNRPICPDCMTQGSVGFHCPECVREAAKSAPVYTARTLPVSQPFVTYALMVVNIAVFVLDMALKNRLTEGTAISPGEGVLYAYAVYAGEWWRLFTSGFLHYGLLHIGMNMFVLYRIGPQIEKLLGHVQYAALYFASMLAGSLGSMLLSPMSASAGASGAIFGLLGAAAAFQISNRINLWQSGLGMLIALNLGITFLVPGIAIGAHLGGIVAGGAVGWAMFELERRQKSPVLGVTIAVVLMVACVGIAIASAPYLIPAQLR